MPTTHTLLVCDDEELIRWSLAEHLRQEGHEVFEAEDGQECLEQIAAHAPDLVLTDIKMPRMDGIELLRRLREQGDDTPVIVITAYGAVDTALEATRLGAAAYLAKPFDLREVGLAVNKVLEQRRLEQEVHYLRAREVNRYKNLIGTAPSMKRLFHTLGRLERVDAPTVLVVGESGTGKDLIAHAIHESGPRKGGPLMEIDCASLPEQLIESNLFGHERGAFTDARATKRGLFEVARGGTIFLDEIGEMSPNTQAKLLRALENRRFKRVGGTADIPLDAGVIAATNRDLHAEVRQGNFREDLFFRLNVIRIEVPSLRERREDIPTLIDHFIERFNRDFGRHVRGVSEDALSLLKAYPWPGNVRELRNVIERVVILEADDVIRGEHLPAEIRFGRGQSTLASGAFVLPEEGVNLDEVERSLIAQALDRTQSNQSAAARLLGISRYTLRYRMEKHGLLEA
ncbi:MAG: sigma-54-dependent Fis family transcriptional regulator [Alphaproteobacteria bacterium]|nr:sigma-54-dependent Fis family transcriptional regulator [Alphaproteobacteria bacterium]MCB9797522.1 sigma-54-dependent Fis family transcriptional regulator [Alphaproteobacteria bacterium]